MGTGRKCPESVQGFRERIATRGAFICIPPDRSGPLVGPEPHQTSAREVVPEAEHRVLERIFVDPDLHRRGIGTRAMELAIEMYPEAKLWTLGTPEWNVRTSSFYAKMGFTQVGWDYGHPSWRGIWSEKVVNPDDPLIMRVIDELKDGMSNFDVEGEIVEKSVARQVRSKRRRWVTLSVANAGLVDDSGRIVLVLWNEQIKHAKVGDRVRIENGYVNSFRGITQLNVGRAGRLIVLL